MDGLGEVEAVEAGGGEDESVALTLRELLEAGVDVAANLDEGDVRTKCEELGAAAGAGGADAAAFGEPVESPEGLADPDVAGVGAAGDGGEGELGREGGGEILEGVDGEVDAAFGEGFFDLFDEDAFAVEPGGGDEAGLLHAVAGGADDLELGEVAAVAESVEDVVRLPESELGAARADADRGGAKILFHSVLLGYGRRRRISG